MEDEDKEYQDKEDKDKGYKDIVNEDKMANEPRIQLTTLE